MHGERDDRLDRELLRRLAAGDPSALGELYDRHGGRLYRHGLTLTRRTDEAEDLVQTVFASLATTGADLLGVRAPANYLHRMLRSAWVDTMRRAARAAEEPLADADGGKGGPGRGQASVGPGQTPLGGNQTPADPAAAHDVEHALLSLPDEQREVVALHVVEGYSFREIGQMTGVSMWTVTGRYRLAIRRLRQMLE